MSEPLQALIDLQESLRVRIRKARKEAEILVAQAGALEVAEIDLDIAIGKAMAALETPNA